MAPVPAGARLAPGLPARPRGGLDGPGPTGFSKARRSSIVPPVGGVRESRVSRFPRFGAALRRPLFVPLLGLLLAALGAGCRNPADSRHPAAFERLEDGLELAVFALPGAGSGAPTLHAVRLDPRRFELRLFMSSADGEPRTVSEWARGRGLVATINAGLYQEDGRTSVSLMRRRDHVNNGHLATQHLAVLAFDPLDPTLPAVQIIDRELQPFAELADRYAALVQGIRLIALDGRNVWKQQEQRHNTAAIAVDVEGRVLLLYNESALTTHDLVEGLLKLPLGLRNAMYLEGGPPAQLWLESAGRTLSLAGLAGDDPAGAIPVPNVLGIARRAVVR